jgi:hypothetical protein
MMTATFGRQLSTGNKNGGTVGDDIRGVQLSGCFIHVVIVYENGEETWRTGDRTVGGTVDGAPGGANGGDIRGVQLAGCFRHVVGV